ncbi:DUF5658 family protein [Thermoproteota archaeon]
MGLLAIFTILDAIVTKIGLNLGCVELNPFVNNLGLDSWSIFRLLLLFYLLGVYFAGYRVFKHRSTKILSMLKNSLYAINIYIGAIVFSGIFHVISRLPI